jgi:hypothetical protein
MTTLQIDRIRQLADIIQAQPHTPITAESGFNMCNWTHTCGTPACIAEWVRFLDKHFRTKSSRQMVKQAEARDRRIEKRKSKT